MFHEYRDEIKELSNKNPHFHKIFEEHNALDDEIATLEASGTDDLKIATLKKKKLYLKDEIYRMIQEHKDAHAPNH
ncbi:YdcH family protein [Helicobacter suis]|nr:DUF465 domain-containing protein [Helicobacter suis]BCD46490.1 hypothetical protein NHP190020_15290 [Helicobacter suis]BCD47602.1 hypothetical protein NHP194003_08060 [Helicobacter suis]BCD49355.1 hypothetical protein NHP194004_08020 [Helicobacter suis]BCD51391.1 hypothetical protein NHP194022_10620 [Helicobacter suis]BDR28656.1 hypothetical protein HSHS1_14170 [Helicobacter suis HS1]